MATSGSSTKAVTKWTNLIFSWSRTSVDIANNKSTIKWELKLQATKADGYIYSTPARAWKVVVNGETKTGTASVDLRTTTAKVLASGSTTIAHNNDGTKQFAFSYTQNFSIKFSNTWIGDVSGSGSAWLDDISRVAEITEAPSSFTDETTNLTVKFKNPGNFDLKFKIEAGGDTALITRDKPTKTSPYTFVLSEDEKKKLRKKCTTNELTVRFTISTYIGGKESYWSYTDKKMTLVNYTPTLSPIVVDQGLVSTTLTGDPNKIILNYNNVKVTFNASAKKEASISSMKVTCGNNTRTSDGLMGYVNNGTFVFSATDSRGYSVSKTITKTTIPYIPLTCSLKADPNLVEDTSSTVVLTVSGNYFSGSFGAVNNSLSIVYRYKTVNGEYPKDSDGNDIWTTIPSPTISNGTYTATATINSLDYTEAYVWQAKAVDKCNAEGILTAEQTTKIQPVFDWSENDFNFNVPVSIQGSPLLDYVIEQGTSNGFTYRKWYSGVAEYWGKATVSVNCKNNLNQNWFTDWITVALPEAIFIESGMVNVGCTDNWSWVCMEHMSSARNVSFRVVRATNYTQTYNTDVNISAKGRWK